MSELPIIEKQRRSGSEAAAHKDQVTDQTGAIVISLDFELQWGVRDLIPLNGPEKKKLLAARAGIPRLLDLFEEFSIHATWATVGLLFARSKKEAEAFGPAKLPTYADPRLNPYTEPIGDDERSDPFHFAPSLIAEIASRRNQEIACHSFSHYYCMEPGQTEEEFECDLNSAVAIAASSGHTLRSFVFPRNEVRRDYLPVLKRAGIRSYRGNEPTAAKESASFSEQRRPMKRAGRLLDSFYNLYGYQTNAWPEEESPLPVNASRYLRPYHPALIQFEPLLVRRVCGAMEHAAQKGEIFHLWWHPEDFAPDYDRNLRTLRRVLEKFEEYRARYRMASLTMAEVASRHDAAVGLSAELQELRHSA
jgi:peptidoglycan/xylan/chitin deacetylase (PgdA/CDA1 family)